MSEISKKIEQAKKLIKNADYILIGAGAGLSTAAGLDYSGKRFEDNFREFIRKYHFTDMYTAGFYNFNSEEEKWAFWAKHIYLNDTGIGPTKLYEDILDLVKDKDYFVITTNVDDQFYKAGFDKEKVFATQGSYKYIQCSKACHNKLYDATDLVKEMIDKTKNCKIPTELVPVCPVCGERMEVNVRIDANFVQDDNWYLQDKKYGVFLENCKYKKVVLLELGVGFNTPGIIRIPFEQITYQNPKWGLIRINKDACATFFDITNKSILFENDINQIIDLLKKESNKL